MADNSLTSNTERTLRLIELLLSQPEGLSPQDMLEQLDLSRSSLFILLRTLKSLGFVEQMEKRGRYRVGPRLLSWRIPAGDSRSSLQAIFYQEAGRREWIDTLALVAPAHQGCLVLAQVEGTGILRSVYPVGEPLAGIPAAELGLDPKPPQTVLAHGYALVENDQLLELAFPVCPDGVTPEVVVLMSAPARRWSLEDLEKTIIPELRELSARLSYRAGAVTYTPYQTQPNPELSPAAALPDKEIGQFLRGPWAARLACIRPDGRPHVIPVWQEWDGNCFTLIAWEGSAWAEYVRKNPNVSLTIDEPWLPLRRVVARGQAHPLAFDSQDAGLGDLIRRMSRRYLGQTTPFRPENQVEGVFKINVDYLRGWQGIPGQESQGG